MCMWINNIIDSLMLSLNARMIITVFEYFTYMYSMCVHYDFIDSNVCIVVLA